MPLGGKEIVKTPDCRFCEIRLELVILWEGAGIRSRWNEGV